MSKPIFGADIRMQIVRAIADVIVGPFGLVVPRSAIRKRPQQQRDQAWIRLIATMNVCPFIVRCVRRLERSHRLLREAAKAGWSARRADLATAPADPEAYGCSPASDAENKRYAGRA